MLDQAFYGLREVKLRVLETLSQSAARGSCPSGESCWQAPPAPAKPPLPRQLRRFSFPHDSVDFSSIGKDADSICGTSRIYSNARPG